MQRGLGTQLRHLTDLLDGAVARTYQRGGLKYRPRYYPVMRALISQSRPLTVTQIAERAGITQPAATQTIGLMVQEGLLSSSSSVHDGRQKVIELTPYACGLLPSLQVCWDAVTTAANSLDAELPFPLSQLLDLAIEAASRESFDLRIQAAQIKRPTRSSSKAPSRREVK